MIDMHLEAIQELVKKYVAEIKNFQECSERFAKVDQSFSSWKGETRDKLQYRMKEDLPAFDALIAKSLDYGGRAQASVNRTIDLENDLKRSLG